MTWYYKRTEPGLFTVGMDDAQGQWHSDSDHELKEDAARRVNFLNGGLGALDVGVLEGAARQLEIAEEQFGQLNAGFKSRAWEDVQHACAFQARQLHRLIAGRPTAETGTFHSYADLGIIEVDKPDAAPNAAPNALAVLAELVAQLDAIGVPDWHGAEGLDLSAARALIAD